MPQQKLTSPLGQNLPSACAGSTTAPPQKAAGSRHCNESTLRSSGPEDFHLRALPEPYVNLSIHTAPVVRPFP